MSSNLDPLLGQHVFYILKHAPYIFKFMLKLMSKGKLEYRLSQVHRWLLNLIFNELKPRTHKMLQKSAMAI